MKENNKVLHDEDLDNVSGGLANLDVKPLARTYIKGTANVDVTKLDDDGLLDATLMTLDEDEKRKVAASLKDTLNNKKGLASIPGHSGRTGKF